jgi:hypothetical protein
LALEDGQHRFIGNCANEVPHLLGGRNREDF